MSEPENVQTNVSVDWTITYLNNQDSYYKADRQPYRRCRKTSGSWSLSRVQIPTRHHAKRRGRGDRYYYDDGACTTERGVLLKPNLGSAFR